jgi:hypothetical protein
VESDDIRCTDLLGFPQVLDVCCGTKGMWFDKQNPLAVYMDKRSEIHVDTYPCGQAGKDN